MAKLSRSEIIEFIESDPIDLFKKSKMYVDIRKLRERDKQIQSSDLANQK